MDLPFDTCFRRRVYLLRHGHALGSDAASAAYTDTIALTERGRAEARAMRDALAGVAFDRVVTSTVARSIETARIVIEGRDLPIEQREEFREFQIDMRVAFEDPEPEMELLRKFAYGLFDLASPDRVRLYEGRAHIDFFEQVTRSFEALMLDDSPASTTLLVAHSMVNRAILCWTLGVGPDAMGHFEQDTGCGNLIEIDIDRQARRVVRRILRMSNLTPGDVPKASMRLLDSEESAPRIAALVAAHRAAG